MSLFDRDAARGLLIMLAPSASLTLIDQYLDALEQCVRPAAAQTIDRDAAIRAADKAWKRTYECDEDGGAGKMTAVVDSVIALLRPVDSVTGAEEVLRNLGYVKSTDHVTGTVQWFPPTVDGVTLTRDEAAMAVEALYTKYAWATPQSAVEAQRLLLLAARLEKEL